MALIAMSLLHPSAGPVWTRRIALVALLLSLAVVLRYSHPIEEDGRERAAVSTGGPAGAGLKAFVTLGAQPAAGTCLGASPRP